MIIRREEPFSYYRQSNFIGGITLHVKSHQLITNRKVFSIINWATQLGGFIRLMKAFFALFGGYASALFLDRLTKKLYRQTKDADHKNKQTKNDQQKENEELFDKV